MVLPTTQGSGMENVLDFLRPTTDAQTTAVSPYVAQAAQSDRTEFQTRFERVQQLARDARAAKEAHLQVYSEKPDPSDDEACVRFEMRKLRLCRASVAAQTAYEAGCDSFFLNADER